MKRILEPKLLASAIIVIIVGVTLFVVFIRPNPLTQPTHQVQGDSLKTGDIITINGHVAYNSYLACRETDPAEICNNTFPQFINLQTANQLLTIIYNLPDNSCDNQGAIDQGKQAITRRPVEALVEVTDQGALTTCSDATHYIQPSMRP